MLRLSAGKLKKLEKLAVRPNREIELSDIPEIREIPSDYVIGKFYRPNIDAGFRIYGLLLSFPEISPLFARIPLRFSLHEIHLKAPIYGIY